jgi:hypothetical protein
MFVDISKEGHFYFPIPRPFQVYNSITWLTDSIDKLNKSHWATVDFYNNVSQCITTNIHGMKIAINPLKIQNFRFTRGELGKLRSG